MVNLKLNLLGISNLDNSQGALFFFGESPDGVAKTPNFELAHSGSFGLKVKSESLTLDKITLADLYSLSLA